ncbi:hypothetical protein R1sor_005518 [Riccia sorocarpa]|uniref:Uncharacterized protein n=1 Tax=Riccia sorocarpa TaxID=122646 RepID=A0ABD3HMS7_9MARC
MSFRELPSYLRPTISSASQSSTPVKRTPGNGTPAKKTKGNLTPGRRTPGNVSLAKILSPVMSPSRSRGQDKEAQNFRDNPLFGGNESDVVDGSSGHPSKIGSLKTAKVTKGNGGTEEPGRNRIQAETKQGHMTPGKTPRVPTKLSGTPPKSVLKIVKRRILSESNENHIGSSIPRWREEIVQASTSNETVIRKWGDEKVPTTAFEMKSPDARVNESSGPQVSALESKGFRRSSVEDLQKRIQQFLETRVPVETMFPPMLINPCSSETLEFSEDKEVHERSSQEMSAGCQLVVSPDSPHSEFQHTTSGSPSLAVLIEAESVNVVDNPTKGPSLALTVDVESVDNPIQSSPQAAPVEAESMHALGYSTQCPSQVAAVELEGTDVMDNSASSPSQAAGAEVGSMGVVPNLARRLSPAAAVEIWSADVVDDITQSPSPAVAVERMESRTNRPPTPVINPLEAMELEDDKAVIHDRPPTPVVDKSVIQDGRKEETEASATEDLPSGRIVENSTSPSGSDGASDSLTAENCWTDGSAVQTATSSRSPDNKSSFQSGDHAANITSASQCAEQLLKLHISSKEIQGHTETHRGVFLTPARSSKPLTEKNIFLTPQPKITEDSSLGRFTAFVPIVRKKGTEKEEVLTPVRRSARIRSRYQAHSNQTPSRLMYTP